MEIFFVDCSGLGLMLYQSFSNLLNTHFLVNHEEIISLLVNNSLKKPESVRCETNVCSHHEQCALQAHCYLVDASVWLGVVDIVLYNLFVSSLA